MIKKQRRFKEVEILSSMVRFFMSYWDMQKGDAWELVSGDPVWAYGIYLKNKRSHKNKKLFL